MKVEAGHSSLYREYRRTIDSDHVPPALRNAILIFFLLQTFVFIPADWVIFPERFASFLTARLALNVALGVLYFGTSNKFPIASTAAVCGLGTLLFIAMVCETGGVKSGYYVGLILLVIGLGVLVPVTGKQVLTIGSVMFSGYALLPLYTQNAIVWPAFFQHAFFLGAACVEAGWASAYMDRMRFADFRQKREIEAARDRLAELDDAKSRFSANIHHELRTPLTLILSPLDALRGGDYGSLPPSVESVIATMQANGRRLHKMINNLLDLAKVESHQFSVHRRPMNLGSLVDELVTGARGLAERKGVEISAEGFNGLPTVYADPEAMEKVLVNLLGNALKFTDSGGRIKVSAEIWADGIAIGVSDSGIGIPAHKLATVFDRFAQVDSSATRNFEGTGIGLSLAKEMIDLHGGRIWAESEGEGQGTTIRLLLPIGEADGGAEEEVLSDCEGAAMGLGLAMQAVEADLRLERKSFSGESLVEIEGSVDRWESRQGATGPAKGSFTAPLNAPEVLIAEDNPDMRELLGMIVSKEFRVRFASNGREALDSFREAEPDLVLSDVMMPEMSGIELCRALKGDESTRAVPIVLVTSKAEREMKIEGLELGADDYVAKPFHPRELMARVRSLIRVRNLQKELAVRNDALEHAMTNLQQAEVQLVQSERLAAVGELAAGIAHEVNNPVNFALNAVRAMEPTVKELNEAAGGIASLDWADLEHLASQIEAYRAGHRQERVEELTDTLNELAEIATEGLTRTYSLVGDLRDFAVVSRSSERVTGVDLAKGIRSTIQLLKHGLMERNATIDFEIVGTVPTVFADSGALNQVFLNLIKNAAEAFGAEGGAIHVSLSQEEDSVVVTVSDNGPGIPSDVLAQIFEPFFTTKDAGRGTGLGLSISRNIIDAHDGELTVESESGAGSRFTIRFPITPASSPS